ncbi:hypothetical protein ACFPM0_37080 [Pseudonocardia sulfidoxydans]|uniref:hypothetical protein n=1 Tax=Pseudonocardia sulfidoxydans TaxID=54011 RepID=UPI00360CEADF
MPQHTAPGLGRGFPLVHPGRDRVHPGRWSCSRNRSGGLTGMDRAWVHRGMARGLC